MFTIRKWIAGKSPNALKDTLLNSYQAKHTQTSLHLFKKWKQFITLSIGHHGLIGCRMGLPTLHLHSGEERGKVRLSALTLSSLCQSVVTVCSWSTYPALPKLQWRKSHWCSAKCRAMDVVGLWSRLPVSNCLVNKRTEQNIHTHIHWHIQIRLTMTTLRSSGLFFLRSCDALVFFMLDFSEWRVPCCHAFR